MADRFKADRVFSDQKKFTLEKELAFMKKQRKIILEEFKANSEEDDRTKKVFIKLLLQLQAEDQERLAHLQSVNAMLSEKQKIVEGAEVREKETELIAEEALQEKSPSEKNWLRIFFCHKVVERLLRDKMAREMSKFSLVESAFKDIKTATGVSEASVLVKKFLNKEVEYGDLLGKIAEN